MGEAKPLVFQQRDHPTSEQRKIAEFYGFSNDLLRDILLLVLNQEIQMWSANTLFVKKR